MKGVIIIYRIGKISALTGLPVKTLRYWSDLGVLVPELTDRFTGYRYYSDRNLDDCRQIVKLKELGFTLDEIKQRDDIKTIAARKLDETKSSIITLKDREKKLEALIAETPKGNTIMQNNTEKIELAAKAPFINDPDVIGKWNFIDLVPNEDDFRDGEPQTTEKPGALTEIFFLTGGGGYYIFSGWTKGKLYLHVTELCGDVLCTYKTREVGGRTLLFLDCPKLIMADGKLSYAGREIFVYEKTDSIARHETDIGLRDKVDYPFTDDPELHGLWHSVDFLPRKELSFDPEHPRRTHDRLFVKEIEIFPGGSCVRRSANGVRTLRWTKGLILDDKVMTASGYRIQTINGRDYLFLEWKSGDYTYGGIVNTYIFSRDNS